MASYAPDYVVRYARTGELQPLAFIVEDARGVAYLFSGGALQCRVEGTAALQRLVDIVDRRGLWASVATGVPATLDQLRALLGWRPPVETDHSACAPAHPGRSIP